MNVYLTKENIIVLQQIVENDINNTHSNKRNPAGQLKNATKGHQRIIFPAFDLSTKIIGLGNRSNRITTVAYDIKCHSAHSTLLKHLLIKSSVLDSIPPPDSTIYLIPHGLIQIIDVTIVNNQII